MRHAERIDVRLTDRQKAALHDYSGSLGVSMAGYVRALIVESIPDDYWPPTPIGGQLTITEDVCEPVPRT